MMKLKGRDEARRLRCEQGISIKQIAAQFNVAYSTASLWVRDIQLTAEQRSALDARIGLAGAKATKLRWDKLKEPWEQKSRELLSERWWLVVATLYWAEGSKRWNAAQMVNSESGPLLSFVSAARRLFPGVKIAYRLALPPRLGSEEEFRLWWVKELGEPACWYKTARPRTFGKTIREGYKGTLTVEVLDYRFRSMIMAAVEALRQEVTGHKSP